MERLARRAIILVVTLTAALIIAAPAFAETEPLEDYLVSNLKNRAEEIDVSEYNIPLDEFRIEYRKLVEIYPEFQCGWGYNYREEDGGTYTSDYCRKKKVVTK